MFNCVLIVAVGIFLLSAKGVLTEAFRKEDEYDFVIVGSGPAGSAIAHRLSEDRYTKVLLLEAGVSDLSDPRIPCPAKALNLTGTDLDWNYRSVPQKNAFGNSPNRTSRISGGKVLGGSSSMNTLLYIRGAPSDFDAWEDIGAEGWSFRDVERYFRRAEKATLIEMSRRLGRNGPLKITSNVRQPAPLTKTFFNAADELGIDEVDYTDEPEGISKVTSTIFQGIRQNAPKAYLRSLDSERKKRLKIVLSATARRVLISTRTVYGHTKRRAYGVEYVKDGQTKTVHARKEVIICAGAIESPKLLLLSGIGPKNDLQRMGISVVKDLPGVGNKLQDHVIHFQFFNATKLVMSGSNNFTAGLATAFLRHRTRFSGTPVSASTKKRPSEEIQLLFGNEFPGVNFVIGINFNLPKSRGTVKLKSTNPMDQPLINPNYYSNKDDLRVHLEGFRLMEKLERSRAFRQAGISFQIPNICDGAQNAEIPRSSEFYRCIMQSAAEPGQHLCCTAKIGKQTDKFAVVDPRLRVYGIDGLRVADASVMPRVTSANTQAPCYMIGEKAADMIKEDWNIHQNHLVHWFRGSSWH